MKIVNLDKDSSDGRAIIRELILMRSPNIEFQTHERDSNYRWEKIKYGEGYTKIDWGWWQFRLLATDDQKPVIEIQ